MRWRSFFGFDGSGGGITHDHAFRSKNGGDSRFVVQVDGLLKLLASLFELQLADLILDLALEIIASTLDLGHDAAELPGQFRQPARPKNDQRQDKDEQ